MMLRKLVLICCLFMVTACDYTSVPNVSKESPLALKGKWLLEGNGQTMLDPQTSGLVVWRDGLLTISDASAHKTQRLQLHFLKKHAAHVSPESYSMVQSEVVQASCFADYLANQPDLEALAVDPSDNNVFYVVTEDASRANISDPECMERYSETGSTAYPTLLLRLALQSDTQVQITHVRPLQYPAEYNIGDFPNDGIEGLAMSPEGKLYLGLEKDSNGQPRIFVIDTTQLDWSDNAFIRVADAGLKVPQFDQGNHPINGMDYMLDADGRAWLVAAARNDDELWFIDVSAQRPTRKLNLAFLVPALAEQQGCEDYSLMDNSSLEGVAVDKDVIWLINDPWKAHYMENVVCEGVREGFKRYSPLLFALDRNVVEAFLNQDIPLN